MPHNLKYSFIKRKERAHIYEIADMNIMIDSLIQIIQRLYNDDDDNHLVMRPSQFLQAVCPKQLHYRSDEWGCVSADPKRLSVPILNKLVLTITDSAFLVINPQNKISPLYKYINIKFKSTIVMDDLFNPVIGKYYRIASTANISKVIDCNMANNKLLLWDYHGGANQLFKFCPWDDSSSQNDDSKTRFKICCKANNGTIQSHGQKKGSQLFIGKPAHDKVDIWVICPAGGNMKGKGYQIYTHVNYFLFDIQGHGLGNSTPIVLWDSCKMAKQTWQIIAA